MLQFGFVAKTEQWPTDYQQSTSRGIVLGVGTEPLARSWPIMRMRLPRCDKTRAARHLVVLVLAIFMTLAPHHGEIFAQTPGGAHTPAILFQTSAALHCLGHDCGLQKSPAPGCCAMGQCFGSLPLTEVLVVGMTYREQFQADEQRVLRPWVAAGPDRPPKST